MNFDTQRLYELLPAIYRIRDSAKGETLKQFLAIFAEEIAVLEENLEQLYDDQFIETCADWAVPYIGDLIGYRPLHGVVPSISSPRAEVARTIAYRQRKGTAAMLAPLARDVTGWPARAVEFFQLLSTTQYMNHIRPHAQFTADLRSWEKMARVETAFDTLGHSIDVRRIPTRAGRYNIRNIGIFVWRIPSFGLNDAAPVKVDARRYFFNPLGINAPLFTRTQFNEDLSHFTEPLEVPDQISRRMLRAYTDGYYGGEKSIFVKILDYQDNDISPKAAEVCCCDLSDYPPLSGNWIHTSFAKQPPSINVAVDPMLGRIVFRNDPYVNPLAIGKPNKVAFTYHYGFGAEIGGGPYSRAVEFAIPAAGQQIKQVPANFPTIQAALNALPTLGGVVEIVGNGRYAETLHIAAAQNAKIELRAAEGCRPTLILGNEFSIAGAENSTVTLNGLLITASSGAPPMAGLLHVPIDSANAPWRLRLRHCTLVPGIYLNVAGKPQRPTTPCLVVEHKNAEVEIQRTILGPVRIAVGSEFTARDSIIDATSSSSIAYAAPNPADAGGTLSLGECTIIGKIHAEVFKLVSNSILYAELASGDTWTAPIRATQKQHGCVRFSWLPPNAVVPRRYRCQPSFAVETEVSRLERESGKALDPLARALVRARIEASLVPVFASTQFGRADYVWLLESCAREIGAGADDESEMGTFHCLFQPQREANLRERLDEYLRFGLEVGGFTA